MSKTMLVADTHVHFYSCYNFTRVRQACFSNLQVLGARAGRGASPLYALFLTERAGQHFFKALQAGQKPFGCEVELRDTASPEVLVCRHPEGMEVWIVAGRQVVTREGLEVAALVTASEVPDGLPLAETVERIRASQGFPVVNWALGKWFGPRGLLVEDLVHASQPGTLALGDSYMRPTLFPEPKAISQAQAKGIAILAGSDALPLAGEESVLGRYGVCLEAEGNREEPGLFLRGALGLEASCFRRIGRRGSLVQTARRWLALQINRKGAHG